MMLSLSAVTVAPAGTGGHPGSVTGRPALGPPRSESGRLSASASESPRRPLPGLWTFDPVPQPEVPVPVRGLGLATAAEGTSQFKFNLQLGNLEKHIYRLRTPLTANDPD
jgi:hypothetical protein